MSGHELAKDAQTVLRSLPKQTRAHATLGRLERAIRLTLQDPEIGRDRFTTGQVAKLAGVSIGTVYRYFPSRISMLDYVWPDRDSTYLPSPAPS
jgi:AcrR family transcriptional regulator